VATVVKGDFRDVHGQFPQVDFTYGEPPWDATMEAFYRRMALCYDTQTRGLPAPPEIDFDAWIDEYVTVCKAHADLHFTVFGTAYKQTFYDALTRAGQNLSHTREWPIQWHSLNPDPMVLICWGKPPLPNPNVVPADWVNSFASGIGAGKTCFDLTFGYGEAAEKMEAHGITVYGCDIQQRRIQEYLDRVGV